MEELSPWNTLNDDMELTKIIANEQFEESF